MSDSPTLAQRFWANVNRRSADECWEWRGSISDTGYGQIAVRTSVPRSTHRVSWELHFGPIPDGMCVLHRCDNRPCVNPDHLFLGTRADNVADRIAKGRPHGKENGRGVTRGSAHHKAKLTEADVARIRQSNASVQHLASFYGVSTAAIRHVLTRKSWRHVP